MHAVNSRRLAKSWNPSARNQGNSLKFTIIVVSTSIRIAIQKLWAVPPFVHGLDSLA